MSKMTRFEREARIAELRAKCQKLSDERARLETTNEREDAAPWIGRCFKYRNRDSLGKSWWLYIRITAHAYGNSFHTLQCQVQSGGWHIATTREHVYLPPDPKSRGYLPISRRQFDAAFRRFTQRIVAINKAPRRRKE